MDSKELIEKFVSGEITEEQFETEKSKLTPEAQEQLKKDAEAKLPDAVEKLKGVRRGIDKIASEKKPDNISEKLREENYDAALNNVFTELGIDKEEDKTAFREGFKSVDSGSVNVENIVKDMKKYFAGTQSDEYFELKKQQKQREADAEEFNAQNGGANGSGGGNEEGKKATKEVREYIQAQQKRGRTVTIEQAERALAIAKAGGHIS